ncbi:MAG: triose-phosphate isomerase [Bacteroidetes bacterium]|nr:triose-phosphate isomerase [Bacteroidota bacterium]
MTRLKIVAGNWKMHKTLEESQSLITEIRGIVRDEIRSNTKVIVCPPYIALAAATRLLEGTGIGLGAQNCHFEEQGAFTGEISAGMIKSTGAEYVIIGHSERRQYFGETNETTALKSKTAIRHGLHVIFCVGETLSQREDKSYFRVVEAQLQEGLFHLDRKEFSHIVIAYEPVWAIGTGLTASPEQAQEMHAYIRKVVGMHYTDEIANNTSILYGGSVKPDNAQTLFSQGDIDGGLIGGAALKARDFVDIVKGMH